MSNKKKKRKYEVSYWNHEVAQTINAGKYSNIFSAFIKASKLSKDNFYVTITILSNNY